MDVGDGVNKHFVFPDGLQKSAHELFTLPSEI
jgi:hypothetical protein